MKRRRGGSGGMPGAVVFAAWICLGAVRPAVAEPVKLAVQDMVEAYFASSFVRPQTNIWQFDDDKPYLGKDRVVCGRVNFQSAGQRYVGLHHFYAIIHDDGVSLGQIEVPNDDDPTGARAAKIAMLCGS